MVGAVGGFNPTAFAAASALSRPTAKSSNQTELSNAKGTSSAQDIFLDWMKKSPAERMEETWLKAHGLSKEKLAAMDPKEREAILKKMKDELERELQEQTEKKAKVDILA